MSFDMNKFKERLLTIDSIGLLYIIVVGGLCHILPIPEIIKGFLALPGFLIIPYLVGKPILFQTKKLFHIQHINLDVTSNCVLSCLYGLFVAWLLYAFFWLFNISFVIFVGTIFIFIIVTNTHNYKFLNIHYNISKYIKIKKYDIIVILLIVLIYLSYMLSQYTIPTMGSYAQYAFVFFSNSLLMDNPISPLGGTYLPYIPLLYGINSLIFNVLPYSLTKILPFLLSIIFVSGIYKFTYQLTKNKRFAIFSVFISVWVFEMVYIKSFLSSIPRTLLLSIFTWTLFLIQKHFLNKSIGKKIDVPLFLYSISLGLFLFIFIFIIGSYINTEYKYIFNLFGILTFFFLMLFLYSRLSTNKNVFLLFGIIVFALISTHFNEGLLYVFLMFVYVLSYIFLNSDKYCKKYKVFMIVVAIVIFLFVSLQYTNVIQFKESSILSMHVFKHGVTEDIDMLFSAKYNMLKNSNSLIIWSFFFIGFIFAFFSKFKFMQAVAFSSIIMYFFYFFPENQFIRASIGQTIIFFSIVITFMIFEIQNFLKIYFSNKYIYNFVVVFVIFITLILGAVEPHLNNAEELCAQKKTLQMFEQYEVNTFQWITLNTPKDTIIFSDPYTANSIKFISFRNDYFAPGWLSEIEYSNQSIKNMDKMKEIFDTENGEELYKKMMNFKEEILEQNIEQGNLKIVPTKWINIDSPIYIVVSGRTCEWLRSEKRIVVTYSVPTNFEINEQCINKFNDKRFFEQVYADENKIYIFKLKNQIEQNESAKH